MGHYKSNLRDIEFNLFEVFDRGSILGTGAFADLDAETTKAILSEVRAMAEGRAIVATRVPAVVDALEDGVSALLVEPGDAIGLAAALRRLVDDRELRDRLGAAAARRAAERHTWPRYLDGLAGAYAAAVESR